MSERRLGIAILVLIAGSVAVAEDTGLLLSVEANHGTGSTLWIQQKGVAVFGRIASYGYRAWTADGLWQVFSEGGKNSDESIRILSPDGTETLFKGGEGRPRTEYAVTYLSSAGFGLGVSMFKADGVSKYPMVYKNYSFSDLEALVEVGSAFDATVVERFDRAGGPEQPGGFGSATNGWEKKASPTNWALEHVRGSWVLRALLLPLAGASQSFSLPVDVGPVKNDKYGAYEIDGVDWTRVRSEYPDALDFTTSPDGKLTAVVTPTEVFVHASSGKSLGRRLQRVRTSAKRIVGAQWITGRSLDGAAKAINGKSP